MSANTVVKAYDLLKKRGVVRSAFGKGFFVASEAPKRLLNVFLLFDELNMFKETLYNSFKETLAERAKIDIFFHHYNAEVFNSLIADSLGRYTHYVVVPQARRNLYGEVKYIPLWFKSLGWDEFLYPARRSSFCT